MLHNRDYFTAFFSSTLLLHWVSFGLMWYLLRREGFGLKDVGFSITPKRAAAYLGIFFGVAILMFIYVKMSMGVGELNEHRLGQLSPFYPVTDGQRVLWIFAALTAGVCEEVIYRGFCINMLKNRGVNRWLAVLIAAIPFILIHGLAGVLSFQSFLFYFLGALFFGVLYVLSNRLWINIWVHALFNLFAMAAVLGAIDFPTP